MPNVDLERGLRALGEILAVRGLSYSVALVGGGSLMLKGELERPTKDLDAVAVVGPRGYRSAEPLPADLQTAIADVARVLDLAPDWLNPGPAALLELGLPEGFASRVEVRRYGALEVHLASRFDQIHLKLYAAVDQGPNSKHFADLRRLRPTASELDAAARWARTHDPSPAFARELEHALADLDHGDA